MTDTPVHRRMIEVDSFHEDDTLRVVSRLRDERPWQDSRPLLHDMELRLRVHLPDLLIVQSDARMHAFPHEECPFISPKFAQLEGLSVTRGFTRALRELFGGVSGCQHLHELARVTGPAVFQASAAVWGQARDEAGPDGPYDPETAWRGLRGSCHVFAPDGPAQQKLFELGWRPSRTEYPVPSVERLRGRGGAAGSR